MSEYKVLLLACSARKHACASRALDLYRGAIFTKGVEYAKAHNLWPMILSAKYGLVNWDAWLDPYDQKMKGNYHGPWPKMSGYYLGGSLYFKHIPKTIEPLVPSGTIGYMLRDLNRLLEGESRESIFRNHTHD